KTENPSFRLLLLTALALALFAPFAPFAVSSGAQEISIPDPGLNAAVRDALHKPSGILTEQDLLSLTTLSACCRNIRRLDGLDAARHLEVLDLHSNSITNFALPTTSNRLSILDLSNNPLTQFTLPSGFQNLKVLDL